MMREICVGYLIQLNKNKIICVILISGKSLTIYKKEEMIKKFSAMGIVAQKILCMKLRKRK